MDAMTLLQQRSSMGKLMAPAPDAEQLEAMYRAALRPDHKELRPGASSSSRATGSTASASCSPRPSGSRTPMPRRPCSRARARSPSARR